LRDFALARAVVFAAQEFDHVVGAVGGASRHERAACSLAVFWSIAVKSVIFITSGST
jgi:hypothetical protein